MNRTIVRLAERTGAVTVRTGPAGRSTSFLGITDRRLGAVDRPVDTVDLTSPGEVMLEDRNPPAGTAFYRVQVETE